MVAFSKSKRAAIALPVLCLALLSLTQISHAQTFANMKYESTRNRANNMMDEDEQDNSHASKLDGTSSVWDMIAAHQKDFFQFGGLEKLQSQWNDVYSLLTNDQEAIRQRRK